MDVARLHIELPDALHRKAKAAAELRGTSLKAFVIAAIESAVAQKRKGK